MSDYCMTCLVLTPKRMVHTTDSFLSILNEYSTIQQTLLQIDIREILSDGVTGEYSRPSH